LPVRSKAQTLHIATISASAKLESKGACTSRFVTNQVLNITSICSVSQWNHIRKPAKIRDCERQKHRESEIYRLKISHKTRPWSSRNSIGVRSFVPVLRQIRKGISSNLIFPSKRQRRTRKQRNWQSKESEGFNIRRGMLSCGRKGNSPSEKIQEGFTEMVSVGGSAVHESRRGSPSPSTHADTERGGVTKETQK